MPNTASRASPYTCNVVLRSFPFGTCPLHRHPQKPSAITKEENTRITRLLSRFYTLGLKRTNWVSFLPTIQKLCRQPMGSSMVTGKGVGLTSQISSRNLVGYGAQPPHPKWPNNAKLALQFVINYEEGGEHCILDGDDKSEWLLSDIIGAIYDNARHLNMESFA